MIGKDLLLKLFEHRGSVFVVSQRYVKGDDFTCPNCNGEGKCEVMKSDDAYSQWTEVQTCSVCGGTKRAKKLFDVREWKRWSVTVTEHGLELSYALEREGDFFLSRKEADAEVVRRTEAERQAKKA